MNTLSWLIYAADIAGTAGTALTAIGTVASLAGIGAAVVGSAPWSRYSWHDDDSWAQISSFKDTIRRAGFACLFIGPFILLVGAVVPSSKAIYMIAASEAGEAIVASPEAREVMGDLKAIIKKKLKEQLAE